jgi:hypothetical protein
VSIDPVLGRIAFADAPATAPLVSFHYGFTIDIGGGEYERGDPAVPVISVQKVQDGAALQATLDAIKDGGTIEVIDSRRYVETPSITVNDAIVDAHGKIVGKTVVLRAKNGARPLLAASGDIKLKLGTEATLILDGWVISGGTLKIESDKPCHLILHDCTLVPGTFGKDDDAPGLLVNNAYATVELERCITAPLHIVADAEVSLRECVVDATAQNLIAFRGPGADTLAPGGALTIESCTVIGKVHTRELTLASDCIFAAELAAGDTWKAPLWAERRQQGCVRFSYVPPGSRKVNTWRPSAISASDKSLICVDLPLPSGPSNVTNRLMVLIRPRRLRRSCAAKICEVFIHDKSARADTARARTNAKSTALRGSSRAACGGCATAAG